MTGSSDSNRSESQGGTREDDQLKEGRSKGTTVGTRTGREAAMRAMSVRESAKSSRHRKTHRVEPDGPGRKFMHLTRGGLPCESRGGVSRGRSSEEGRESGWSEGPKDEGDAARGAVKAVREAIRNVAGQADEVGTGAAHPECGLVDSSLERGRGLRVLRIPKPKKRKMALESNRRMRKTARPVVGRRTGRNPRAPIRSWASAGIHLFGNPQHKNASSRRGRSVRFRFRQLADLTPPSPRCSVPRRGRPGSRCRRR